MAHISPGQAPQGRLQTPRHPWQSVQGPLFAQAWPCAHTACSSASARQGRRRAEICPCAAEGVHVRPPPSTPVFDMRDALRVGRDICVKNKSASRGADGRYYAIVPSILFVEQTQVPPSRPRACPCRKIEVMRVGISRECIQDNKHCGRQKLLLWRQGHARRHDRQARPFQQRRAVQRRIPHPGAQWRVARRRRHGLAARRRCTPPRQGLLKTCHAARRWPCSRCGTRPRARQRAV